MILQIVGAIFTGVGLATAAVELVMALGFKAIGMAAKGIVKGAKGVAAGVKAGPAKMTSKGFGAVVRGGKFVFNGVKKLKNLGGRLLKRFKIKRAGKRFQIWGKINSWILCADGALKHIEKDDLKKSNNKKGKSKTGDEKKKRYCLK